MNRSTFIKGMGLGLVVGSAIGMACMPKRKKSAIGRALKTVGGIAEELTDCLGL